MWRLLSVIQETKSSTLHAAVCTSHPTNDIEQQEMPLVPQSILLCHIPCSRMNPDFVASSSLVSGTVTAHTSHFGSAILSFLPLLPCCLLPKQQVHHSQHFYPPPCNSSTASSSMHLSAAVSSSSVVCSSLYSPPCLIFTAPIPQSLQTHL